MASLHCTCDAVEIEFFTDNDLFRNQCCCYDCTAALRYANQRGGPPAPPCQCVDSSWFPNDFRIVRGEDKLGAFLNFADADSTRFHCTNCWTVLFADHPVYARKVVVTQMAAYTSFEGLKNATLMPVQSRHFVKDVPPDQISGLPSWHGSPGDIFAGPSEKLLAAFPAMQAAGSEGTAMNAQILLKKIGGADIPKDEPGLSAGPPTLIQQTTGSADRRAQ